MAIHSRLFVRSCIVALALSTAVKAHATLSCRTATLGLNDQQVSEQLDSMADYFVAATRMKDADQKTLSVKSYKEKLRELERLLGMDLRNEIKWRVDHRLATHVDETQKLVKERETLKEIFEKWSKTKTTAFPENVYEVNINEQNIVSIPQVGAFSVFNLKTESPFHLEPPPGVSWRGLMTPDMKSVLYANGKKIAQRDRSTAQDEFFDFERAFNPQEGMDSLSHNMAYSKDGRFLYVLSVFKTALIVIRTSDMGIEKVIPGIHGHNALAIPTLSPSGRYLESRVKQGGLIPGRITDLQTWTTIEIHGAGVTDIVFDEPRNRAIVLQGFEMKEIDLTSGTSRKVEYLDSPTRILPTRDGKKLLALYAVRPHRGPGSKLRVFDLEKNRFEDKSIEFPQSETEPEMALMHGEPVIAISTWNVRGQEGAVKLLNYETGDPISEVPVKKQVKSLIFDRTDNALLGAQDGKLFELR